MGTRTTAAAAALLLAACATEAPQPNSVYLVDLAAEATVEGTPEAIEPPAPTAWTFADGDAAGWEAAGGIEGLEIRDGALVGRTTGELPLLHLAWEPTVARDEPLHAVEVRMAASQAGKLRAEFADFPGPFDPDMTRGFMGALSRGFEAPLEAGDEAQTYTLRSDWGATAGELRHFLVVPSDVPGTEFRIESIRLVFRSEHLAGIPSGVGWQGLAEIYRETVVARAPETWHFDLTLPQRPLLDLAVGTVEQGPVRFAVELNAGEEGVQVMERTVTRPHLWQPVQADLSRWAGQRVELTLSVAAPEDGALGFWGAPAVRNRVRRTPDPDQPQGVILVVADTLRRDHLSSWGHQRDTSPVLAGMAEEGVLFRDAIAQATWTKASMPSMLTSLYVSSHGVSDFDHRLSAAAETLAEAYREAGYATHSQISVPFVGRFTNLHQGFEVVHEPGSLPEETRSKTARDQMDRLLPWLEEHRDVPFFALLHVFDPHDPYEPYAPYDTLWTDPAFEAEFERQLEATRPYIADPLLRLFGAPSRAELEEAGVDPGPYVEHERGWYDASIRAMDTEIGRLLERLEELGLSDRVLIAFASDHGEEFLEHGRHFHGQTAYGELANVPMLFYGHGIPAGREVTQTVQNLDLMPTLLELSGVAVPEAAQGRSLVPLIRDGDGALRPHAAVTEKQRTEQSAGPYPRDTASTGLLLDGWKLVHHTAPGPGKPEFELFDHQADPVDLHDVAGQHPEVVTRLTEVLEAWREKAAAERLPTDAAAAEGLSTEERERLRALGYL